MRPFHLNDEEVSLIKDLRCLTTEQRSMVSALVHSLEGGHDPATLQPEGNVSLIRAIPN